MSTPTEPNPLPQRLATGVPGLDDVLSGGVPRGGVYIVMGTPGAGKTILGSQLAFNHVARGGRVVWATLLSETHGRLLAFLSQMSFYDPAAVGDALRYLNGYANVEREGLTGLLEMLRGAVREARADLLIVDGMVTASTLGESETEYKKFVQQLQTWLEVVGCTVVLLTSAGRAELRPEFTMVDGIVELDYPRVGARRIRELTVTKLRGSAFREGKHGYAITSDGITVFPRLESLHPGPLEGDRPDTRVPTGIDGIDRLLEGGFVPGTTTLVTGASGTGKTTCGLHFLAQGARAGEQVMHYGFYEAPRTLLATSDVLGLGLREAHEAGRVSMTWRAPSENLLDRVGNEVLQQARALGARRLLFDGIEALRTVAEPERVAGFLAALTHELRRLQVTTFLTSEARELVTSGSEVPLPGISAIVENILLLRQVERDACLHRVLSIVKTRNRAHDRGVFEFEIRPSGVRFVGGGAPLPPATRRTPGASRAAARPARKKRAR